MNTGGKSKNPNNETETFPLDCWGFMQCLVCFGMIVLAGGQCISLVSPCMGSLSLGHAHSLWDPFLRWDTQGCVLDPISLLPLNH